MRVLFCTDGSKISYGAMVNFSHWFKGFSVDILSVADWSCLSDNVMAEGANIMAQCTNSANSILNYTEEFLNEKNIKLGSRLKSCGSVVDSILEAEKDTEYDYIILGSNGKKGIQKWLGSVSQEVSNLSGTSVYISKRLNSSYKVVFALDNSLIGTGKFIRTMENIDLSGKEIHLLTVYETPDYLFLEGNIDSNWVVDIDQKQKQESLILLNQYEKIFKDNGYEVAKKSVLSGVPSKEIIDYCEDNEVDLVVSGMRQRKYFAGLFPGSVSRRILEYTPADTLIMK